MRLEPLQLLLPLFQWSFSASRGWWWPFVGQVLVLVYPFAVVAVIMVPDPHT